VTSPVVFHSPGSPQSHDGFIRTRQVYKNHVKTTFPKGASLEDPSGFFNASLRAMPGAPSTSMKATRTTMRPEGVHPRRSGPQSQGREEAEEPPANGPASLIAGSVARFKLSRRELNLRKPASGHEINRGGLPATPRWMRCSRVARNDDD
jgi:hypothetical protein